MNDKMIQTETDEMLDLARLYSESIKAVVRETIAELNIEQSCYCTLLSCDDTEDDLWTVRSIDGNTSISGLMNCSGRALNPETSAGSMVVVNYIGGNLSNGYISRIIKAGVSKGGI